MSDQYYEDISINRLLELVFWVERMKNICDDDPTNNTAEAAERFSDLYKALCELTARRKLMGAKSSL